MDDFEDLEGELQGGEGDDDSEEEGDFSGDDDDLSQDDEEEEGEVAVPVSKKSSSSKKEKKSSSSSRTTTTEQDEKAMLKQLTQAASADVEKGRDVKKQLVSPTSAVPYSVSSILEALELMPFLWRARRRSVIIYLRRGLRYKKELSLSILYHKYVL